MLKDISVRKYVLIFILTILVFFGLSNFSLVTNKAEAASNVWAEKSKVEFGENIKIHYNFDDRAHAVKINIYMNGALVDFRYNFDTSLSNTFTYSSYTNEGTLTFEVIPLDAMNFSEQAVVKVYKHRVILIPGIMASELYHNGSKVWLPGLGNIWGQISKMEMKEDGSEKEHLTAGVPIDKYYKTLHDYLNIKFHVIDFGYDWRFGATANATLLKDKINTAKATSPDSKIYLVAHSMGGIIATEYINLGYGRNVDKLITIGTPYLGAPKAAFIFETGNASGVVIENTVIAASIRKVMPNILSAYQLLPSKKYFSLNSTSFLSRSTYQGNINRRTPYKHVKLSNFESTYSFLKSRDWANSTLMLKAQNFHENLDIMNNLNSVDSYYIIGDKVATLGGLSLLDGEDTYKIIQTKTIQGDGTVPVISASVGKSLVPGKTYYTQEEHTKLPGNVNVQKQVENILLGNVNQLAPSVRKFTEPTKTLKLKIESPVDLNVYDNSGNHLGYSATGELEENIPFASFYTDGETKIALLNDGDYNVKLQGTGYGDMIYSLVWSNEQDEEVRTVRFDEIAVTPNTIFTSGTNANGQIELRIDENGDGNIDSTITPSVDLDAAGTQDEIKPTISSAMLGVKGVNEWYGKDAAYKLTGRDDESGLYKVFYSLDDSDFKEYTDSIKLPETGIYKFKSFARDKNRNDSDVLEETIKVDTTSPSNPKMVVEPLKWTNKFVSVTLSDAEDKDSGFQTYQYKIGENSEWINYKEPVIISNEGLHKVFARTIDNVFNASEVVSGEAKVDKTPPSKPIGFKTVVRDINQLKISWESSTDNVEVVGYDVYLNSAYITNVKDSEYTFTNLTKGTSYSIKIVARDEAENSSEDGLYYESTPSNLISTGTNHTIRMKPDGSVWSWGNNANGQLGDGTTTNKTTAVQVEGLNDILTVAAGDTHSLALKRDGSVWAWGSNASGQLGTGDTKASLVPIQIPELKGIVGIASGWDASYALKRDGTVWSWGANNSGQLGDGTSNRRLTPVQVMGVSGVSALSAGNSFALALKSDGTVWGWGDASSYQLGDKGQVRTVWKAEMIAGLSNIKSIEAGRSVGFALTSSGDLYRWGSAYERVTVPTKWQVGVKAMSGGSALSGGGATIQVVKNDGSLWVLGGNAYGELGLGHTQVTTSLIQNRNMSNVVATAGGVSSTFAIKSDGSVWSFGLNDKGQLGDGTITNRMVPVKVLGLDKPTLRSMKFTPSYFTVDLGEDQNNENNFEEGDVTVTLSVYGLDGMKDESFTETKMLKITNYSDDLQEIDRDNGQSLLQDINFIDGVATFSLTLDAEGLQEYEFELEGFEDTQKVTLNVESKNEEAEKVLTFVSLPSDHAISGASFSAQPVLRILNRNGEPVPDAVITAEIAGEVRGSLIGAVQSVSDAEGYIRFEDLGAVIEESEGEIVVNFKVANSNYFISSPMIKISSPSEPSGMDSISSKLTKFNKLK